jgi:hypothetical protein
LNPANRFNSHTPFAPTSLSGVRHSPMERHKMHRRPKPGRLRWQLGRPTWSWSVHRLTTGSLQRSDEGVFTAELAEPYTCLGPPHGSVPVLVVVYPYQIAVAAHDSLHLKIRTYRRNAKPMRECSDRPIHGVCCASGVACARPCPNRIPLRVLNVQHDASRSFRQTLNALLALVGASLFSRRSRDSHRAPSNFSGRFQAEIYTKPTHVGTPCSDHVQSRHR